MHRLIAALWRLYGVPRRFRDRRLELPQISCASVCRLLSNSEMCMTREIDWLYEPCPVPSATHIAAAEARQRILTKPPGSLGSLERLVVRLAGLQGVERPCLTRVRAVLFAADHGVTAHGVSAYPADVTVQMLHNFSAGGAAISVLASEQGMALELVDVGTLATSEIAGVISDKVRCGTRDLSIEPAMTAAEAHFALSAGRRAVQRAIDAGSDLLILGEMGIGNTTAATAMVSALLGRSPIVLAGAGAGLDAQRIEHKAKVISDALKLHDVDRRNMTVFDVIVHVGGFEIAALVGAMISAAQARLPVLVDGFIVTAAVLAATRMTPSVKDWLIFSHRSAEQGHRVVLDALDVEPILDLQLRLGEGSGAALALPIIKLACALHTQMATFAEARISEAI